MAPCKAFAEAVATTAGIHTGSGTVEVTGVSIFGDRPSPFDDIDPGPLEVSGGVARQFPRQQGSRVVARPPDDPEEFST
jgi:hypothetical protein